MAKWLKLGKIFDPTKIQNIHWMKSHAQGPHTLIFDNFVRVYFSCRPFPDDKGKFVSYTGYVDLNRNNLFEIINISKTPILPLGEKGTFDEFGIYPTSVIRDKEEIIAYYGGWTRCDSVPWDVAIGMAISKDGGNTFEKVGKGGPILSYSPDEPFIVSGPKIRKYNNKYYLFYISGKKWILSNNKPEPVYQIRLATSKDGYNWDKENRNLIETKLNENECQASPDVIYSNGKYHMFFCYKDGLDYRNKNGSYRVGYAYSEDLINWIRDDNNVGIDVSETGWDSEMMGYPHVFELDGNIYMLYFGNSFGKEGFGIAKLIDAL